MTTTTSAPTGRPRDARIDDAVLAATRALLVEVGYTRLSYALIAERAGVTRPAIYRRWPSKAHIVHDAVFPTVEGDLVPESDNFERDLRRMIARTLASYVRPEARVAVPGLLTDLEDADRRRDVVDGLQNRVRVQLAARIARAITDGEVHAGVDADLLLDTIIGALIHRVVARQSPDPRFAEQLADLLLDGLRPRS